MIVKKIKRRITFHDMLKLYATQISEAISKVLLGQSRHTYLFTNCLLLLLRYDAEVDSYHKDCMARKA